MAKLEDRTPMFIRLPQDVKDWLAKEAARTGASQNSEIVRSLLDRMEAEQRAAR